MSQMGQKRTSHSVSLMSALPPKADIAQHGGNVRFVPKADILYCSNNAGLLGQVLPNFRQQFSFDTYFISGGLRKNPHGDDHEGCRGEHEISEFRPHRRTAPIGENDRNNSDRG
jgi:hypothetical protein